MWRAGRAGAYRPRVDTTTPRPAGRAPLLRALVFLLGGTSVASLLAWVFGLGAFHAWFWAVSVPGQVALLAIGVWVARREDLAELRALLVAGLVGGILGTIGYDLFRVPFVLAGLRVLAPIDSYGVLALDAAASSTLTGFTGWSYHFANGIGFGLSYAVIAGRGRHWGWGIGWAMVLETATIVTPFATTYALRGGGGIKWVPITIAYAAHVPYGYALGKAVQRADRVADGVRTVGRWTVPATLLVLFGGLAVWLAPWSSARPDELGTVTGPAAVVLDGEFEPEWLRVEVGGCVTLVNLDDATYQLNHGLPATLPADATTEVCFDEPGVHRVRTSDEPYAGGFVIVDEQP